MNPQDKTLSCHKNTFNFSVFFLFLLKPTQALLCGGAYCRRINFYIVFVDAEALLLFSSFFILFMCCCVWSVWCVGWYLYTVQVKNAGLPPHLLNLSPSDVWKPLSCATVDVEDEQYMASPCTVAMRYYASKAPFQNVIKELWGGSIIFADGHLNGYRGRKSKIQRLTTDRLNPLFPLFN